MGLAIRALMMLGYVWALPLSLLFGVVLTVLWIMGMVMPSGRFQHSYVWEVVPGSWLYRLLMRADPLPDGVENRIGALAFGFYVLIVTVTRRRLLHEDRHVQQQLVCGPLSLVLYPLASFVSWVRGTGLYTGNWFEVDARRYAGEEN